MPTPGRRTFRRRAGRSGPVEQGVGGSATVEVGRQAMLKRLLFALGCAVVGGALGYLVGLKPSVIGPRVTCFVGVGIGFITGLGVADPSIRRVPFGILGALVGGAIG